ncbi:MAG: response regulator [Phycisphaerales bacterium]
MLIIERKVGAMVRIGRHVTVRVRSIRGNQRVRLEIDAPKEIPVVREELDVFDDSQRGVRQMTVLIVEDDEAHAEIVELAMSERQVDTMYRVDSAEDALATLDGLAEAGDSVPDLILLDQHLPGVSGEDLLRQLRERPDTKLTPIVMLSGDVDDECVRRCMAAGANAYLEKKPTYSELADAVARILALFEVSQPASED